MQSWADWIDAQPVHGWRIVTLEYPRWNYTGLFHKAIKHTMRELTQTFLTGPLASQNKASGANSIRRVVALGGDTATDTAFHAHCLVDGIGDDEMFKRKLHKSWVNNTGRLVRLDNHAFHEREAKIYSRRLVDKATAYMNYIVRSEGNDLKFGVTKIDVLNTYLTPPSSSRH